MTASSTETRPQTVEPPVAARQGRGRRRPWPVRYYLIYAALGVVTLSSVSAFLWVVNVSLKTNRGFLATSPWSLTRTWSWHNYVEAWTTANISGYFANSVVVSVASTLLGVFVAAFAAYPIARVPFRGAGAVLACFILGLMVPWMVTFIPLYLTLQDLGLLNSRLGLVLVYATYNLPFNVFVLVGYLKTLPDELEEAAAIDGAGPLRTFVTIILPLMAPGLASVGIVSFLSNWNEFFYALLIIRDPEKSTLPLGLFQLGQAADYGTNWVTLFAGMMITAVPVLLVFALLQKHITRGITAGALKG